MDALLVLADLAAFLLGLDDFFWADFFLGATLSLLGAFLEETLDFLATFILFYFI